MLKVCNCSVMGGMFGLKYLQSCNNNRLKLTDDIVIILCFIDLPCEIPVLFINLKGWLLTTYSCFDFIVQHFELVCLKMCYIKLLLLCV